MSSYRQQLDQAVQQLRDRDPKLAAIIKVAGECTLKPHGGHWEELADSIISQQLSVKAARTILGRFKELGAGEFPTANEVRHMSVEDMRAAGLSGAKVRYVKDLAEHVLDGRLDLARIAELPNEEIIVELTDIKGIGEWTAHMYLIFSLGRLDVLPVGDLGVRKAVQIQYGFTDLPTSDEMRTIARKHGWEGAESVAAWYLWRSLDMKQAFEAVKFDN